MSYPLRVKKSEEDVFIWYAIKSNMSETVITLINLYLFLSNVDSLFFSIFGIRSVYYFVMLSNNNELIMALINVRIYITFL